MLGQGTILTTNLAVKIVSLFTLLCRKIFSALYFENILRCNALRACLQSLIVEAVGWSSVDSSITVSSQSYIETCLELVVPLQKRHALGFPCFSSTLWA